MKNCFLYLLFLCFPLLHAAQTDSATDADTDIAFQADISHNTSIIPQKSRIEASNNIKTITAEKKWLLLPVKNGAEKKQMEIRSQGEQVRSFEIELADDSPDWYAHLDISEWEGEKLEIWVNSLSSDSQALTYIEQAEEEQDADELYKEAQRGQFHFSPKRGWNNDPNGLVYYDGEYHLFFQHNPYGVQWGNMHWGHAVSKDLVHWEELDIALYPDDFGTMYSGGAVVDSANTSGLGEASNPPMVLFYTAAGSWVQGLAYSTDGREFKKTDPILPKITEGNRDPKVIWYEPTERWVMVLYVTEANDQHTMHFFTSRNLRDWEPASTIKGGVGGDSYLFECPEFFELPVEGKPGEKKWILTGANSQYAIGTFDGTVFKPESERLNGQKGRDFYAAQTFSNEPQGRRIEIGWWRTHTSQAGANFNQSMSIPMELKLIETSEGLRLTRTPVEELKTLREEHHEFDNLTVSTGQTRTISDNNAELLEIRTTIEPGQTELIQFNIRGIDAVYNVPNEELTIDGVTADLPLANNKLELRVFVDRTGLEVFSNQGLFFMPVNVNLTSENLDLSISAQGGDLNISELDVYELTSAWK